MIEQPKSISVIIPVYNENALLEKSIAHISKFLKTHFRDYEIIIVESGSNDGSFETCDRIAINCSNINVMHEGARNGFGSAFMMGCKNAKKDLIWLITVDLPFLLDHIFRALPLLDKYDCVLSFRSEDRRNIYRKFQSVIYNALAKWLLGLDVKHVNSAFKVFKREVIEKIEFVSRGWFIDTEIVYRLKENNIPYTEIAVPLIDRSAGESTINLFTPVSMLKELIYFLGAKDK